MSERVRVHAYEVSKEPGGGLRLRVVFRSGGKLSRETISLEGKTDIPKAIVEIVEAKRSASA